MKLSSFLGVNSEELEVRGILDKDVDADIESFLYYESIRDSNIPEFENVSEKYKLFFSQLWGKLNKIYEESGGSEKVYLHPEYRKVVELVLFREYRGVGLGYADSYKNCKGWTLEDAKLLIERLLVQLSVKFVYSNRQLDDYFDSIPLTANTIERIGPDKTSDMLAFFIHTELARYTERHLKELITIVPIEDSKFSMFVINGVEYTLPRRAEGYPILFIPKNFVTGGYTQERRVLGIIYDLLIDTGKDIDDIFGVSIVADTRLHSADVLRKKQKEVKRGKKVVNLTEKKEHLSKYKGDLLDKVLPVLFDIDE